MWPLAELQKFIQAYPQSEYNTEAKDLLVSVLANTSNYYGGADTDRPDEKSFSRSQSRLPENIICPCL